MKRFALAGALLLIAAAAPAVAPLLRAQAWTDPAANPAHALTHAPGECVRAWTPQIEAGRALFRSPILLGGPAARAGLSCNACHSNGRVNQDFLLPELTDRPGAADVTSAWSSKVRGDGVMNPVDIPDLVGASERTSFGHGNVASLDAFMTSVIEEEFQGAPPPAAAFAALGAYVRALDPGACPAGEAAITLASAADDVRRALDAARQSPAELADVTIAAAQDAMGRIVERLPARRFARQRWQLELLARELGALRGGGDIQARMDTALPGWRARFDAQIANLARRERRSYFDEATLARALSAAAAP